MHKNKVHQKSWTDAVKNVLLDGRIDYLLRHFQLLKTRLQGEALVMLERLIHYYLRNQHRMYYGFYREKKLFIGSGRHPGGAIESAHREVIQQRLKRSGQRWSNLQVMKAKKYYYNNSPYYYNLMKFIGKEKLFLWLISKPSISTNRC